VTSSTSELSFDAPAPPGLLKQRGPEQIFLTDWTQGDEGFTFAARLPLQHPRYSDTCAGYHDILVISETIIQVGMTASMDLLGVPPDWAFFVHSLEASLDPLENNVREPDSWRLTLSARDGTAGVKFRPDGSSSGAYLKTINALEGRPSGASQVKAFWMSPDRYREFRSRVRARRKAVEPAPASPQPETMIGRENPANSVISRLEKGGERRYRCSLIVDTGDPTFYDRPFDHVSGMLLCEGARQAATAAICHERGVSPADLVICAEKMNFTAFAELDEPTRCEIELDPGSQAVGVEFTQSGRAVCRAALEASLL